MASTVESIGMAVTHVRSIRQSLKETEYLHRNLLNNDRSTKHNRDSVTCA